MDITERFLKYVSFNTNSDEFSETVPSSPKQKELGAYLAEELKGIGLDNAFMDENGYVYGFLPATSGRENEDNIGFIAHMDTSPDVSGDVKGARVIEYCGGDIELGNGKSITVSDFPFIEKYKGKHLIVTDGTSLLGADDKAGIAEIVSALEYLINHSELSHRGIAVCFTPDEEIGRGTDHFSFDLFNAKAAYTLDGGELGEIEYENFNAASVKIDIYGVNIHPGSAKNKMKNAVLIGSELISMLPGAETPAHTEKYEGFYHVSDFEGNESAATVRMIIRDHDMTLFTKRKAFITEIVDFLNKKYGEGTIALTLSDSYYNMKEKIKPHFWLVENAEKAMRKLGVEPVSVPIRGGTDGAMLSYKGLPCPNLCTGGANFHSVHEFVCVESMETITSLVVELSK